MPHYYSRKNTEKFGDVSVTPREWYRRTLWKGTTSPFAYKENDIIKFRLKMDRFFLDNSELRDKSIVYKRMGNGSLVEICEVKSTDIQIETKASYQGDTKIFLAVQPALSGLIHIDENKAIELFDEDVRSLNSYMFGWEGIVVGALLTGICSCCVGIFLSLVIIRPYWEAWIPWKP